MLEAEEVSINDRLESHEEELLVSSKEEIELLVSVLVVWFAEEASPCTDNTDNHSSNTSSKDLTIMVTDYYGWMDGFFFEK
jgi:hypothetical protein